MFQGQTTPAEPKEPAKVHQRDGVEVPYTPTEMQERNRNYDIKKAIWDKTMKVPLNIIANIILWMYGCNKMHIILV